MKYRLKDICSITKGATGIMKADGGKYPLVALSEERRSHSEFQFDSKAVIVPLISSTGHGHASMKRVHYQEGKFALGNILCAVIPKNEKQLNAKFLHLYLQQFKDSLLVPLMKGAANVSLPMNKLADVEIEVPSFESQLEIIALEEEAAGYKNELEERLIEQDNDVAKLRQALLREAMQGKLTKQNEKDGYAKKLLESIIAEKNKLGKKQNILPPIKVEEIPFDIPENWIWCRLGEIGICQTGTTPSTQVKSNFGKDIPFIKPADITLKGLVLDNEGLSYSGLKEGVLIPKNSLMMVCIGGSIGKSYYNEVDVSCNQQINTITPLSEIQSTFLQYWLQSTYFQNAIWDKASGGTTPIVNRSKWESIFIPIPPLAEQNRIINRLVQLMQLCDEMQYSIQQSKIENEKLLQGALRDALKKEESVEICRE